MASSELGRGRGPLPVWLPPLLMLMLLWAGAGAGAAGPVTVYVSRSGKCTDAAPRGAECSTLPAALRDPTAARIVLLEDITVQHRDWPQNYTSAFSFEITRDVVVTAVRPQVALDFNFVSDVAAIDANRTLVFSNITIENSRRGAGLGIDFFAGGADNSVLELRNVVRLRYVCTAPGDAVKVHKSYPRAPQVPGPQSVTTIENFCWRSVCFQGGSVHYIDFAMVVSPGMSESTAYLPGYTLILRNTTRICESLVPDSCLQKQSRDQCLMQYTDAFIESLHGSKKRATIIGAVVGSVAIVAIAATIATAAAHRSKRRKRQQRDEEAAAKALMHFGPMDDVVLSNQQHGWKVTHRANMRNGTGSPSLTGSFMDRIELGVLLGAGSFGRVYKGRWQGKDVAVKVMQHDARTASRIANEVELMMMMEHCNILRAYDVITWTHTSASGSLNQGPSGSKPSDSLPSGPNKRLAELTTGPRNGAVPTAHPWHSPMSSSTASRSPRVSSGAGPTHPPGAAASGPLPAVRTLSAGAAAVGAAAAAPGSGPLVPAGQLRALSSASGAEASGASALASSTAAVDPGGPSFTRGGRPISFVPVRSLAGGAVAPLIVHPAAGSATPDAAQPGSSADAAADVGAGGGGAAPAAARASDGSDSDLGAGSGGIHPDAEAQTWLVVEYCDSGTLADAVRSGRMGPRGAPDMAKVLVRLRDIAAGLAYLHSRNVLHGDLKAANVLLASSHTAPFGLIAKVADFGLSRMLKVGQTHRSTRTVGTVTHMPPELLRLGKLSPAGDVYAFGILMWELFTGSTAFDRQHYGEVFERVVLRDERPPVPPSMPEAYGLLMTQCWQADPMSRPGFDTVLRLINLMIDDMTAAGDNRAAAAAAAPPGSGGAPGSGGGSSKGRVSSGTAAEQRQQVTRFNPAVLGPPRDGSHFFQDL